MRAFTQIEEYLVPGHNLFTNNIASLHRYFPHWDGAGIRLSVKEFRFDSSDVDIFGRVISNPNAAANVTSHANIMASLAGGAGNADWSGLGAAPGCSLISSSFVGLMPDTDYASTGITVQNHSYGIHIQNRYDERAAAYDRSVEAHPELVHVFSAGNKGDSAAVESKYNGLPGFANLSGAFKMAKNILLAGSIDSFGIPALRSSKGPAYDGRIKPDLMAFGKGGSSESAALVSGTAAVIQQALLEVTDTFPYTDLVRALLINSATDIGAPGPDFESGFGSLNARKAVEQVQQHRFTTGQMAAGQTLAVPVMINSPVQTIKLTLAWTDPPALPDADKALINDLDLRMISPTGEEYYPWVINTYPHPDSLRLPAGRGRDSLNNVEQIGVLLPETGLWEVQVKAPEGMSGSQHFGLAWTFEPLNQFTWEYPLQGTPAFSGKPVLLQWKDNHTQNTGTLKFRDIRSANWEVISDSIGLNAGWTRWVLPDTFGAFQLNMTIGGLDYPSDTFVVSPELTLKVGFNCPDSVMLYWNGVSTNAEYQLFGLGDQYLEPILSLSDTFVVLKKNSYPQKRFAVAANNSSGMGNRRSPAPDISSQGLGCYFRRFLAEWYGGASIDLELSIGTTYGISSITIEKRTGTVFSSLADLAPIGNLYFLKDDHPNQGVNEYRARLNLSDGNYLYSDVAEGYYSDNDSWWVFPNPANNSSTIQWISRTEETGWFELFDVYGNMTLETSSFGLLNEIPLNEIASGMYFFRIWDGEQLIGTGKLVIE